MGFWRDLLGLPEKRSITSVPWQEFHTPFNQVPPLPYDTNVNRALTLAPVYAAVRLIADSISTLPLKFHRRNGDDRTSMNPPQLFDQMLSDGSLVPWLFRCVTSQATRGNALGMIATRDGFGFPTLVDWLDPTIVAPDDRPGARGGWLVNGRAVPRQDIVHIPLFTVPGKRLGLSPIASYASTVGVGLQAQQYASDWFGVGGFPPGTFKNSEQTVTPAQADEIKARLNAALRTRTPLVYGRDWDYNAISVPPEEAQFVETMKMTTNQIAAIYGIPPEMIGGETGSSMTYANVEQQQINFVMFTLRPWLVRMETVFSSLLPDRQYVKFNADAMVRADLKSRWEVNQIRFNMGAASIDEIRAQEDEPPLPNGQGQVYGPPKPALPANPNEAQPSPLRRIV